MDKKRSILAFALVAVSTIAASMAFYVWQIYKSANLNVQGEENFVLYIPKGSTYQNVLDSLRTHKMINEEISFGFITKREKYRDNIKPGRYEIPPNSNNKEIIRKLKFGEQDPIRLTFNNVRTKQDLVNKIGHKFDFDPEELMNKITDEAVCESYGFNNETIMNMFLPDTYFMYWTTTPDGLLDRMKQEYDKFWNEERRQKAQEINMTPNQIGTLASIVQSETNKTDEMPKVAGVYINRLAINMILQADPTVKFAIGDFTLKRILNKHLTFDSPYNTYKYIGLPPGPIAMPERAAIDAVLNYEKHNYLYFSAREDFSGYHNFAENLQQHGVNARKYHQALNERGIK